MYRATSMALLTLAAAVAAAALPAGAAADAYTGTSGAPPQQSDIIGGYSSSPSLTGGDVLDLRVSAPAGSRYRIDIVRLGVGGVPGEQVIDCIPGCGRDEPAVAQPAAPPPDAGGEVAANWQVTDTWQAPDGLATGYYLARFVVASGPNTGAQSWYPFLVRPPPDHVAKVLVIVPVNTWQAYNDWGGKSLYNFNSTNGQAAWRVSFDRPYARVGAESIYWFELSLLALLNQTGYDVGYLTDVDIQRNPALLAGRKLDIVAGHSEYWSAEYRDGLEWVRDNGTNIAFLGANDGYWEIRYQDGERTLYRHVVTQEPDGEPGTGMFRALPTPRPECQLLGVEFATGLGANYAHDYTVAEGPGADTWLNGTGLSAGDTVFGLVGFEWDALTPGCAVGAAPHPSQPETLFSYKDPGGLDAEAARYRAASGATVFSAGTLSWDSYLAGPHANPAIIRFTKNMLDDLTSGPDPVVSAQAPASNEAPDTTATPPATAPRPQRVSHHHRHHRRHHH